MAKSNDKILDATEQATLGFIKEFQDAPYRFLYESDIQAGLFNKIREVLPDVITFKGSGHPCNEYRLSVVNTEYGAKIDIACLDIEKADSIEPRVHKGGDVHLYQLPVLQGIEIKYRKLGDKFGIEACIADLNKLERLAIANPLILGFIQHKGDVEDYFSNLKHPFHYHEVSASEGLAKMNIISPDKRWRVDW